MTKTLAIQLLDGATSPQPLPAEILSVQQVVTDPDKDAAVAAQNALANAQAVLNATIASNPAGCSATPPPTTTPPTAEDPRCTAWRAAVTTAQSALTKAQGDLATAQACDALNDTTASFTPAPPDPLITGVDGFARLNITVSGLYAQASTGCKNGDAKVQFIIGTVGPEITAPTLTITVSPQGAATTTP
ncbi:MAG: hypothetical protein V9H25_03405 [Candidatus Competibacter sp.]